jgi:hypothetical protein
LEGTLAPTNPYWAHVVDYGPVSLCVIHKEGLCPSSGDINRMKMIMNMFKGEEEVGLRKYGSCETSYERDTCLVK